MFVALICFSVLITFFEGAFAIDCFVCSSINGNNTLCEDAFDPLPVTLNPPLSEPTGNGSLMYLDKGCLVAYKSRPSPVPATACLKLAGHFVDNGESIVVRACALGDGSIDVTSGTETSNRSHCGGLFVNDRYIRGCLETCFTNGCNSPSKPNISEVSQNTTASSTSQKRAASANASSGTIFNTYQLLLSPVLMFVFKMG